MKKSPKNDVFLYI